MFKQKFKYFKRKNPNPDFDTILDIRAGDPQFLTVHELEGDLQNCHIQNNLLGLKEFAEWKVYELKSCPGLIFILNPFTSLGQRYWIARSVADYSRKPSLTNLDNQDAIQKNLDGKTWWEVAGRCNDNNSLSKKLRWATMGYHHNWDSKVYSEEAKSPLPNDLSLLSKHIVKTVLNIDFHPEASIVNYYFMDSFLSGHVDRSERNLVAPLVSLSFGQTAVFLVGGRTLDENPEAMLLESGDIVIMVGNSRFRYHGVPRIISAKRQPWKELLYHDNYKKCPVIEDDYRVEGTPYDGANRVTWDFVQHEKFWLPFDKYLNGARINLNVRQVI